MGRTITEYISLLRTPTWPYEHAVHDFQDVYLNLKDRVVQLLGDRRLDDARVLDLGCGYTYPNVALFQAQGVAVCGADIEPVFFRDGRLAAFRARRRERGLLRAAYWAGPGYSGYRHYFATLAAVAHADIDHAALQLRTYDGRRLPFDDRSFDVVCSNAVLEHVDDLPAFAAETARVLRPGGVVDMVWHNFYSPSGGHRSPRDVELSPWGHITGESPPTCYLNRKPPEQMRSALEERLVVTRVTGCTLDGTLEGESGYSLEGVDRLDDDWRTKLPDLPAELLTTRAYLLQGVRRG